MAAICIADAANGTFHPLPVAATKPATWRILCPCPAAERVRQRRRRRIDPRAARPSGSRTFHARSADRTSGATGARVPAGIVGSPCRWSGTASIGAFCSTQVKRTFDDDTRAAAGRNGHRHRLRPRSLRARDGAQGPGRPAQAVASARTEPPESIVITDTAARIEYVNQAFVDSTGYARENCSDKTRASSIPGARRALLTLPCGRRLSRRCSWKGEFINRRKDGSEYVEFAIVTPLRQADGASRTTSRSRKTSARRSASARTSTAIAIILEELVKTAPRTVARASWPNRRAWRRAASSPT